MIQLWPANEQADKYPQALLHPFITKEQFQIKEINTTLQDTFFFPCGIAEMHGS